MSFLASNRAITSLVALPLAVILTYTLLAKKPRAKKHPPWIDDLSELNVASKTWFPGTAVVCGGSIAGIFTARICADHFQNVVLIDPEFSKVREGKTKTRVMQYHSLHTYRTVLINALRRLWPKFDSVTTAAGGIFGPYDMQFHYSGVLIPAPYHHYAPQPLPETLNMRRPEFERCLQRLLLEHPTSTRIRVLDSVVRRLEPSSDKKSIQSVVVRDLDGKSLTLNDVALVADCSGSTQAGMKWLTSAGYSIPDDIQITYDPKLHYVTITYAVSPSLASYLPPQALGGPSHYIYTFIPHPSLGDSVVALSRMDNDTIQLLFGGWNAYDLPKTIEAIEPFINAVKGQEPIPPWVITMVRILNEQGSPVFDSGKPAALSNVRYDLAQDLPSNFVAVGDSTMTQNPLYGQGCTKAMIGALALSSVLKTYNHDLPLPQDLSRDFFRGLAARTQGLWNSAKVADYGFSATIPVQGETLATGRFGRWVGEKIMSASVEHEEVAALVWHVRALLIPASEMYSPRMLWKILWASSRFAS